MKIVILKAAKQDLREGFFFYESQKVGLGVYFLETLSSDIDSIEVIARCSSNCFTLQKAGNVPVFR